MTDNKKNDEDLKVEEVEETEETQDSTKDNDGIKELRDRLEAKEKESEDFKEQLLRLQADFMNFKRRAEKSKQDTIAYALESFISDILPIIDNFERALESNDDREDSFSEGISMIYGDLERLLVKNNVEKIQALNEEFDPNLHHAVFMEESKDHKENVVIEVLQTGYRMKDRVIRPAMVKVSK